MKLDEAVKTRINEILEEKGVSLTALCLNSLITPSTLFGFMYGQTKCPSIMTIKKICYGAGMTIDEFFAPDYFKDFSEIVK